MKHYIYALLFTVASAIATPNGIQEMFSRYEQLCGILYRSDVARDDLLSTVKACVKDRGDLFTVQSWFIADDQEIKATMLDIALILLKCQEKVLTFLITHDEQISEYEQEFQDYEQEKLLAYALRQSGVEQQLTEGEISHYADIMVELFFYQLAHMDSIS